MPDDAVVKKEDTEVAATYEGAPLLHVTDDSTKGEHIGRSKRPLQKDVAEKRPEKKVTLARKENQTQQQLTLRALRPKKETGN